MADTARPVNPFVPEEADIYEAVRAFVLAYALPALDSAKITQGRANLLPTPDASGDYAVITVLSGTQRGSAVRSFAVDEADPAQVGVLSVRALMEVQAQVHFYGNGDASRLRAQRLALLARSAIGVEFFKERGLSAWYADEVKDDSLLDANKEPAPRCLVTLHLSHWNCLNFEMDYFESVAPRPFNILT